MLFRSDATHRGTPGHAGARQASSGNCRELNCTPGWAFRSPIRARTIVEKEVTEGTRKMTTLIEEARAARRLPAPQDARQIRVRAGISASRMAREVGVSHSTLLRWEDGTFGPRGPKRVVYVQLLEQLQELA